MVATSRDAGTGLASGIVPILISLVFRGDLPAVHRLTKQLAGFELHDLAPRRMIESPVCGFLPLRGGL